MRRATHRVPGLVLTDHEFAVPLDHARLDGDRITVFAREAVATARERDDLPWLVFFQGGPGGEAPRPTSARDVWLPRALKEYRVLLLDQRGTGRSTPLNRQTLATLDAEAQAAYLRHFRADAIVRDAEWIRRELLGDDARWSVLGQSYGGFCVTTYLSFAPEGLREALITGGLPPLAGGAEEVYRATYPRVLERNRQYYERYPDDAKVAEELVATLRAEPVPLPCGDPLTPRRLQLLGHAFGMRDGFERLHYLLEDAFVEGKGGRELSDRFLRGVEAATSAMFATNPLYAIVHEACYCQGAASRWAAERVRAEFPEFDLERGGPVYFTGEMIYPWLFEEDAALRPLREAAELLAAYDGWPALYDPARLAANEVPSAAAVYYDDMYVDAELSLATARAVRGLRVWVTNEHEHDGLRRDGEALLDHLIALARGER